MSSWFPAADCSTLTEQRLKSFVDRSQQFLSAAQPGHHDLPYRLDCRLIIWGICLRVRGSNVIYKWKLSYRKDDRAMRSIMAPWYFSTVPEYAHGYFSRNFNGLLFRSIMWMCVQNLKFAALPVPEVIRGIQKIWAVHGYARAPFSQNCE